MRSPSCTIPRTAARDSCLARKTLALLGLGHAYGQDAFADTTLHVLPTRRLPSPLDNLLRPFTTFVVRLVPGVTNITLISTALGAGKTRIPFDTIHMAVVRGFAALGKLDNASVRVVPFSFGFFPLSAPTADHHEDRGNDEHGQYSHDATIHRDKHKNYSFHCGRTHRRYGHSSSYKRTRGPNNSLGTLDLSGSSALAARLHRAFRHLSCPCPVQTATTSSRQR